MKHTRGGKTHKEREEKHTQGKEGEKTHTREGEGEKHTQGRG